MISDIGNYFLYRHVRLDKNEVFYVGIGTKGKQRNSYSCHYREAMRTDRRNPLWRNIVTKAEWTIEIIIESPDYHFIKNKEIEFIKLYGRINLGTGTLANFTDGGDGTTNKIFSIEYRKKISEGRRGIRHTDETKRIIREKRALQIISKESWEKRAKQRFKVVNQFNLDGEFIRQFESIKEAASYMNMKTSSPISMVCRGERNKAANHVWRFGIKNKTPNSLNIQRELPYRDIIKIKELLMNTKMGCMEIARTLNVKKAAVKSIKAGKAYKWVEL
jgi:hypothetical protein